MTTMTHFQLCQLSVERKRDVIVARQRARQVAALLGFEIPEQTRIASAVFELARQALEQVGRARLDFEVADGQLHVRPHGDEAWPAGVPLWHLELPLPQGAALVADDDLPWVASKLMEEAPANVFDEFVHLQHELLRALLELQRSEAQQAASAGPRMNAA
jgi:hypothetical protein